jgi:hypothetical protein
MSTQNLNMKMAVGCKLLRLPIQFQHTLKKKKKKKKKKTTTSLDTHFCLARVSLRALCALQAANNILGRQAKPRRLGETEQ